LFPQLTVQEHIEFFSRLKGLYSKYTKEEVDAKIQQSIEDVALLEKRNTLSKNLSGGMKRKLSVAIAFCGESKTVLLDEPTSGMDPFSRRFTWNVIRQYRQNRCIVLTTHFMDGKYHITLSNDTILDLIHGDQMLFQRRIFWAIVLR
jgi:ABC-type multidrug transport system ATPase subunit